MRKLKENEKQEIKEMIADKLGYNVEEIQDDSNLKNDLGSGSLDDVELIMELENMFDISIHDEYAEDVKTVSDCYEVVERYIQ